LSMSIPFKPALERPIIKADSMINAQLPAEKESKKLMGAYSKSSKVNVWQLTEAQYATGGLKKKS
jgi:hypothetical protein